MADSRETGFSVGGVRGGQRCPQRRCGRTGHDGRRHRRGVRSKRRGCGRGRSLRAGAGPWSRAPDRFDRSRGRPRQALRGGSRRAGRPHPLRGRPRCVERCRPGHRGRTRAPRSEAEDLRGAGPGLQAESDPRDEHVVAVGHRDLGRDEPTEPGHRHALLQSRAGDEAGRGHQDRRHRARCRRRRRGVVRAARQGRRDDQRPGRFHRQRAAVRLPQPRRHDVRGPLRQPGGHRRRDEARLRAADGAARVDGPHRARHRVRDPRHHVPPGRPRSTARAGANAQADGDRRSPGAEERSGLLHVREGGLAGGRRRRVDAGRARGCRLGGRRPPEDPQGRRDRLGHHGHRHHRGLRPQRVRGRRP